MEKIIALKIVEGMAKGSPSSVSITPGVTDTLPETNPNAHLPVTSPEDPNHARFSWEYPKSLPCEPIMHYQGTPPVFDDKLFSLWKCSMQDHIHSTLVELWKEVVNGFNPVDPKNLTSHEATEEQLNSTTCTMIQKGLSQDKIGPYLHIIHAKESWDKLIIANAGTTKLQLSKYEMTKNEMHFFVMEPNKKPQALLNHLNVLMVKLQSFECDKEDDGFIITNRSLVSKLLNALAPHHGDMVFNIQQRSDFAHINPR